MGIFGLVATRNAISYPSDYSTYFDHIVYVPLWRFFLDVTKVPNLCPSLPKEGYGGGGGWRNSSDKKERDTKSSVMLSWRVGRGFCPSHLWRTVTPLTDLCRKTRNAPFASPAFLLLRRSLFFPCLFRTICLSYDSDSSHRYN